jgi:hypothetical protein
VAVWLEESFDSICVREALADPVVGVAPVVGVVDPEAPVVGVEPVCEAVVVVVPVVVDELHALTPSTTVARAAATVRRRAKPEDAVARRDQRELAGFIWKSLLWERSRRPRDMSEA